MNLLENDSNSLRRMLKEMLDNSPSHRQQVAEILEMDDEDDLEDALNDHSYLCIVLDGKADRKARFCDFINTNVTFEGQNAASLNR